ncbi:MAG: EAL domain-containing protein, partial [Cyanobacteria bacterium P01_F01_bin.153]
QNFPVDTLKIDRSFVAKMKKTKNDMEVVRAIVSLAHAFELSVVAEGIESSEQVDQLEALGCQFGQGFLFSKPLSFEQIESRKLSFFPLLHNCPCD